jgi:hypothetical protein
MTVVFSTGLAGISNLEEADARTRIASPFGAANAIFDDEKAILRNAGGLLRRILAQPPR